MCERPIILRAHEVRGILAGRVKQVRRPVKPQPRVTEHEAQFLSAAWDGGEIDVRCPFGEEGDRLLAACAIPGASDTYCAGSDGVVYSRSRGDWRPLKTSISERGYPCVTIMKGPRKATRTVHSLVCSAFYGASPFVGAQVRHLDGDRLNSTPGNLAWGTQAENWQDRRAHGRGVEGEKHHCAKLSDAEREMVRWAIEKGLCSRRHAARVLGMSKGSIIELAGSGPARPAIQDIPSDRIPRLTLTVADVRVERVQDATDEDIHAEGIHAIRVPMFGRVVTVFGHDDPAASACSEVPREAFRRTWDSFFSKRDAGWDANPWTWVVSFEAEVRHAA